MIHLFVLCFALFAAQATTPATPPPSEPPAMQTAQPSAPTAQTPAVQHVQPYTAKQTITHVQTMADGTINTTVTPLQIWRDANGRYRSERIRTLPNGTQSHFITISDPVTRISMNWTVGDPSVPNVVDLTRIQQPIPQPAQSTPITSQTAPSHYTTKSESLPPQTIDGLYAVGTRYTRTDKTTTTEVWNAQQFGIQLRLVTDDPINGKTTTEATDIQLVDPDPALFQPPADYQLKEAIPPSPNPNTSGTHQGSVTGPKILHQPDPQYTQIARQQRITGVATVMCLINAQGNPENVHVIKSIADTVDSKHRAAALTLDQAAIDTVKKYKFKPATEDGKPIAVYLNVQVNFLLY
jgi:TonB family protein